MSDTARRLFLTFSLTVALALGVGVGYVFFVPPLERDIAQAYAKHAELKAEFSEFQFGVIRATSQVLLGSAAATVESLHTRGKAHEEISAAGVEVQVNIATAKSAPGHVDLDALYDPDFVRPVRRLWDAAAGTEGSARGGSACPSGTALCVDGVAPAAGTADSAQAYGLDGEGS
ncbi:hypothetical protein LJC59_00940 [Desulfovibrio sp. OttesenSCG-928-A18]|nr:hypothetical protein [Desulfovibrio sp. OttesenSCG-928-A18]